ncbi:phage regulatory CII family protein [Escherichia coli]|nr:phage regulatory CII family protein [Escherichia coli]
MFDYQVSKHPHFDEACRAFALRHNLVQLAERAGMNVQILRNKLNPAQPHLLTAPEIWLLTDLTEDSTLVDGFLAQIHCLPCVPINEVAKEKLPHYVMSATAEIGRVAAGAVPAPQIVDVPDFETLLAERKAEFVALHPKDEQEAVMRTLELESEPVTKLLQENAYRELLLRQRINEAALAVMVAYAIGSDLDQLAANYNVKRLTVTPANNDAVPPVAAVMESDEALRLRVPAAFEGLSVAGPTAAYEFHARSADGRVADASATSPAPAEVVLTVLSREGDGTAEKDLLDVVEKALNSENVRPVADRLTVRSAEIIPYRVEATIFLYPGPEAEPVMAAAKASLQKYIASQTRLGRDIRRSAIFAALHVEGVQRVELASPLADVVLNKTQAASCTQWSVTNGGTDE